MGRHNNRPSVVWGLLSAWRMRRLVVVVWLVAFALVMPASMMVTGAVEPPLANLPPTVDVPAGEVAMLLVEAVVPILRPLRVAVGTAMLLAWAFTLLWHAGVARFEVWGNGPPVVSHILGLGLTAWWRYCRLSVLALGILLCLMAVIWTAVAAAVSQAFADMAEERMVLMIAAGLVVGAIVKIIVWAATLRGAWELAVPTSRSVVRAWVRGLVGVFRSPLSTIGSLLILGAAMAVCAVIPLVVPALWPMFRGGPPGVALDLAAGLGVAFFSVALFNAFAPVSGLVTTSEASEAETSTDG